MGAALPWSGWQELGLSGLAFALLVLLLRRPPVVAALRPALQHRLETPDTAFIVWFGPIGVAALYYAMLAREKAGLEVVWHGASLVIVASILIHGLSASPLTRLYAHRAAGPGSASPRAEHPG
jgi:NhaP-type Na+/H+ or K+/H+ antiporter